MKTALTAVALALSLGLAGVASPVDAQSGGYRGGPPPGGGYRGGPPPGSGFRGAPPPGAWGGAWRGPGWNGWGRPWGPAWRPGWGWGGWGWGPAWGGWGWGVGWNPGWAWGPGYWGWSVGAPIVVGPPAVSVWAPPLGPTVYVESGAAVAETSPAAPPPAPSAQQWWYWCGSARGYYPYVESCPEGWQRVPPQVPPARQ
jgi:hypothetical protein